MPSQLFGAPFGGRAVTPCDTPCDSTHFAKVNTIVSTRRIEGRRLEAS